MFCLYCYAVGTYIIMYLQWHMMIKTIRNRVNEYIRLEIDLFTAVSLGCY